MGVLRESNCLACVRVVYLLARHNSLALSSTPPRMLTPGVQVSPTVVGSLLYYKSPTLYILDIRMFVE